VRFGRSRIVQGEEEGLLPSSKICSYKRVRERDRSLFIIQMGYSAGHEVHIELLLLKAISVDIIYFLLQRFEPFLFRIPAACMAQCTFRISLDKHA